VPFGARSNGQIIMETNRSIPTEVKPRAIFGYEMHT
jgi:hypothetical protein